MGIIETLFYKNSDGKYHREDGPAIIWKNGTQEWFLHGKRHRTDGPAIVYADGTEAWYLHDKRHRTDGPAVIRPDGTKEWYLNDRRLEFKKYINKIYPTNCPEKTMFIIKWS